MIKESFYGCPDCGRKLSEMKLSDKLYTPSFNDRTDRPGIFSADDGSETNLFLCPCGKEITWFTLQIFTVTAGWAHEFKEPA